MKGYSAFAKAQHYWNLTIWLFNVIIRTLIGGGVLPFCRDEVGIFYSPNQLDNLLVGEGLTPLQRCSRCIQQPQPIGQFNDVLAIDLKHYKDGYFLKFYSSLS